MDAEREELHRLVDDLTADEVSRALADVRKRLPVESGRSWPPAWFGSATSSRIDTAARADELLAEGFGQRL